MLDKNSTILITGAAGFIGSNLVKFLNQQGYQKLILVDDLTDGRKFKNIKNASFIRYLDRGQLEDFLSKSSYYVDEIDNDQETLFGDFLVTDIDAVIHLGACSSTTEWNGAFLMENNYEYSVKILNHILGLDKKVKLIYASSASVYGNKKNQDVDPLNPYAFSKLAFDRYVFQRFMDRSADQEMQQIVGLRFFNVCGPMEDHKGDQASPIHKFYEQVKKDNEIKIFDVNAKRDFVYIEDVCKVIQFFLNNEVSGIFDVGSGVARSFDDVANIFASQFKSKVEKIEFPEYLKDHYQYYTCANLDPLRAAGYKEEFLSLEDGIAKFLEEKEVNLE